VAGDAVNICRSVRRGTNVAACIFVRRRSKHLPERPT
jgi:hypothetical protein